MDRVDAAVAAIPRAGFLPPSERGQAGYDGPLPIGHGQTSSQPRTVTAMLRLLDVRPGHRVLDVGAGSGWTAALLAWLVGPDGSVLGIERIPELARWAVENVRLSAAPSARVVVRTATAGVLGAPDRAPFDRILVSADAPALPPELVDQLGPDARMVVPVAGWMTLVQRLGDDVEISRHGEYRFVPLLPDAP